MFELRFLPNLIMLISSQSGLRRETLTLFAISYELLNIYINGTDLIEILTTKGKTTTWEYISSLR